MKKVIIRIVTCFWVTISMNGYSNCDEKGNFNVEKDTLTDVQILTDSSIKYVFGYACSVSGMPPKGRQAINKLVESKNFETIKAVLDGHNNVGKIYAIEALLLASPKACVLSENDKEKIKDIINQDCLIRRCQGCFVFSIKTIDLFNEESYMKLLIKNGIKIKNR